MERFNVDSIYYLSITYPARAPLVSFDLGDQNI